MPDYSFSRLGIARLLGLWLVISGSLITSLCISAIANEDPRFRLETVATGLDHPWSIAFLPEGEMLVTERGGRLRIIRNGILDPKPVTNTPATFVRSQGGYFDILAHPNFSENRIVYLSFAHGTLEVNSTRIVRARFDGQALQDLTVIFDTTPDKDTPNHYGGRMAFLPDGSLIMTTGDGFEYREEAQRKDNSLGKTIRINDDGSIPRDNPFFGDEGTNPAIWTLGHRSPQGLVVDPATNIVYQHEHGPRGGDEINILAAGHNYGWPIATFGIDYSGATISPFTEYQGMVQPIKYWTPSIAPSGLTIYRGSEFEQWDGNLFVGALASKNLRRLEIVDGEVIEEETLLEDLSERIRDVRTGPDGYIYLTTDTDNGRVIRLVPR